MYVYYKNINNIYVRYYYQIEFIDTFFYKMTYLIYEYYMLFLERIMNNFFLN